LQKLPDLKKKNFFFFEKKEACEAQEDLLWISASFGVN
jgi:hypothetical protein